MAAAVTATVNNVAANNVVTQNLSDENAASGVLLNRATGSVVEKNLLVRNLVDGVRMSTTQRQIAFGRTSFGEAAATVSAPR